MRQAGYLDEAVIVGVVVHQQRLLAGRAATGVLSHPQRREVAGAAEAPGVVVAAVAVHVHVPVGVDAGVARGRFQLRSGVTRHGVGLAAVKPIVVVGVVGIADAEHRARGASVPGAVGDAAVAPVVVIPLVPADQSASRSALRPAAQPAHAAGGVAGADAAVVPAGQTADVGPGAHVAAGVAGDDAALAAQVLAAVQAHQAADPEVVVGGYRVAGVAGGDDAAVAAGQSAGLGGAVYAARGGAVADGSAGVGADQAAGMAGDAAHRAVEAAVQDAAPQQGSHHAAGVNGVAGHAAGYADVVDFARGEADQAADLFAAFYIDVRQVQVADDAVGVGQPDQTNAVANPPAPIAVGVGAVDEQVADGVVVALEDGAEPVGGADVLLPGEGGPALASVPVGWVAGFGDGVVVVLVKVQVRRQLVAGAARRTAQVPALHRVGRKRRQVAGVV